MCFLMQITNAIKRQFPSACGTMVHGIHTAKIEHGYLIDAVSINRSLNSGCIIKTDCKCLCFSFSSMYLYKVAKLHCNFVNLHC